MEKIFVNNVLFFFVFFIYFFCFFIIAYAKHQQFIIVLIK